MRILFVFLFCLSLVLTEFVEDFNVGSYNGWVVSEAIKTESQDQVFKFDGIWKVEPPHILPGLENDYGLVVKSEAKHHAISKLFPNIIDPKDKVFVVQYEIKFQELLECGGAYLKLITNQDRKFDPRKFDDKTPYSIMFGPDRCGSMNKIHFIIRHKNPITGKYEEKHLKTPPVATISKLSSLYTLVIHPNNNFSIHVNQEKVFSGSLLMDLIPPINPLKEIDDMNDIKPLDWVDEEEISDSSAVKPLDWDESAPMFIEDLNAVKPEDWLEDEPLQINDPNSIKPKDWNDEEDQEWVPNKISNPKCKHVSGCGPWRAPKIKNPNYRGKWVAPMVKNPLYKGPWKRRKIPNPDYFEDPHPHNFEPIVAIGFELWTMQKNILFDNIFIGYSEEMAFEYGSRTWAVKYSLEKSIEDSIKKNEDFENQGQFDSIISNCIKMMEDIWDNCPRVLQKYLNTLITLALVVSAFVILRGLFRRSKIKPKSETVEEKEESRTKKDVPQGIRARSVHDKENVSSLAQ